MIENLEQAKQRAYVSLTKEQTESAKSILVDDIGNVFVDSDLSNIEPVNYFLLKGEIPTAKEVKKSKTQTDDVV